MDTKNVLLLLSQLTVLLEENKNRLLALSDLNPSPEQLLAFKVYHQNVEQLIRNLLSYVAQTDCSLTDLINYRIFEMDLDGLLNESRIS
ncbi:hypothetical protein [Pedobacter jeongneungensis]|uniref:hypothetical protein n=1 Tax=Pedobacter jeongneungensis TaxID=947309 RepID=UPI00046850E1|nr:hypothetical protein [Pedobacter jeongneungensis]